MVTRKFHLRDRFVLTPALGVKGAFPATWSGSGLACVFLLFVYGFGALTLTLYIRLRNGAGSFDGQ